MLKRNFIRREQVAQIQNISSSGISVGSNALGIGKEKRFFNADFFRKLLLILSTIAFLSLILYLVCTPAKQEATDWADNLVAGTETWAGKGTKAEPFLIASEIELAQLAVNVNAGTSYKDKFFALNSTLNLSGKQWTAIGTLASPFKGTFDGKGNSIWYLTAEKFDVDNFGLFGVISEGAYINDIKMFNPFINVSGNAGTIVGQATGGTIENCYVLDSLVEYGRYLYKDNSNRFKINNKYLLDAGGIIAIEDYDDIIKKAWTTGVSGSGNVGGIVGYMNVKNETHLRVYSCVVKTITISSRDNDAGGIVGELRANATNKSGSDCHSTVGACFVIRCTIKTSAASSKSADCGGIAGYLEAGATSTNYKSGNTNVLTCFAIGCTFTNSSGSSGNILGQMSTTNSHGYARCYDNYFVASSTTAVYGNKDSSGNLYFANNVQVDSSKACTSSSLPSTYKNNSSSYSQPAVTFSWSSFWKGVAPVTSGGQKTYYYPALVSMSSYKEAAKVENSSYTISYTLNSGTAGSSKPTSYTYSSSQQRLTVSTPTRSGYDFDGWSVSRGGTYGGSAPTISGTTLTIPASSYGNITLTANWSAITYTRYVYAYCNSATSTSSYSQSSTGGTVGFTSSCGYSNTSKTSTDSSPTRYASAKTGYTFNGWYSSSSLSSRLSTSTSYSSSNSSLYAKFSINSYSITVNPNGGTWNSSTSSKTVTQYYNTTLALGTPTRTGYTFNGWSKSGSGSLSGNTYTFGAGTATITASWTINTYTLTVNSNGNGTVSGGGTYNWNSSVTIKATPNEGYNFLGWKLNSNSSYASTSASYTVTVTANATYTAYFQIKTFTVTVSAGNTGGTVSGGGTYNWNTSATIKATPSKGFKFDYWTVNGVKQSSTSNTYTVTVKQAYTIQAFFKIARYMSSSSAGGEVRVIGADEYTASTTYVAFPYAGYYLNGWFIDNVLYKNGSTIVKDLSITLPNSTALCVVVNAVFSTNESATPSNTFDTSTGISVCAEIGGEARLTGYESNASTVHLSAVITSKHYSFDGWYIYGESTALSKNMSCDLSVSSLKGKTVVAKFKLYDSSNTNDEVNHIEDMLP